MKNQPEISTILYATDLGDHTRPVFRHALSMAKQYRAVIIMLHVVEPINETALSVINTYLSKDLTDDVQKEAMRKTIVNMKERLKKFYVPLNKTQLGVGSYQTIDGFQLRNTLLRKKHLSIQAEQGSNSFLAEFA